MGKKDHKALGPTCDGRITKDGVDYRSPCPEYIDPDTGQKHKFPTKDKPWRNEIHHILCEHAITDFGAYDAQSDFIRDCLCDTPWDINSVKHNGEGHNLLGLPLKPAYRKSYGREPVNLPCHDVDHPEYTEEVQQWLEENVWKSLAKKTNKHDVDLTDLATQLRRCTSHFKRALKRRGRRNGGTVKSWQNQTEQKATWFLPFSLSKNPRRRVPYRQVKPQFTIIQRKK
jgi:hypothetical protein